MNAPTLTAEQEAIWNATPQPRAPYAGEMTCWCRADGCVSSCGNFAAKTCRTCFRPTCELCLVPLDGRCIDCWVGNDWTHEPEYGGHDC